MLNKNKLLSDITPFARLLILILFISALIIAKSIYLILLMTVISLIIILISNIRVNICVKFIKKHAFMLLIFLVMYIILLSGASYLKIIIMILKTIIIILSICIFEENINFDQLHEGIYGLLLPLKILNIDEISKSITFSLCFIKYWFDFEEEREKLNEKNFIFSILSFKSKFNYALVALNNLQLKLKLNFYNLKYAKLNIKSTVYLIIFILFFILCVFKEVVL